MKLTDVEHLFEEGRDAEACAALRAATPEGKEVGEAAALALRFGLPSLSARWWRTAVNQGEQSAVLGLAAALLRLGRRSEVQEVLADVAATARTRALLARASLSLEDAEAARALARAEGDAPALIAAVTLLGELLLGRGDARAALLALAEGLKVAEIAGDAADAHLLAVLSHAQARIGSARKAEATARKALGRALPRSPARVLALHVLGAREEAQAEARAGELAPAFFAFKP